MWQDENGSLHRKFEFRDFKQAFEFMTAVAKAAEAQGHHPKWLNDWNKVEIWLTTHSQGGITDKDHKLAAEIDKIEREYR
jgi:4a-hydroxytetrahydrobiopterin dehydratase